MKQFLLLTLTLLILNACVKTDADPMVTKQVIVITSEPLLTSKPKPTTPVNRFCTDITEIPEIECVALVQIYSQTNLNFNELQSSPCLWEGVSCNHRHVTILDLRSREINYLPPQIGNFPHLTLLYLNDNNLKYLPTEIGNLTALQDIHLESTNLIELPAEIGNLGNLLLINVKNNNLSNLPLEMGKLDNLRWLNLENNKISSLPMDISSLPNLLRIIMPGNNITHLPLDFCSGLPDKADLIPESLCS